MLSRGAVAWPVERRPLKFAPDAKTDGAGARDGSVNLSANRRIAEGIAANLLTALDALRQLSAGVEKVLDVEVEVPWALLKAGRQVHLSIALHVAIDVIDAGPEVARALALIGKDTLYIGLEFGLEMPFVPDLAAALPGRSKRQLVALFGKKIQASIEARV